MSRTAGLFMVALLCAGAATAQTQAYRCGADGRSYSQDPCDGGRPIELADPRTASQAAQTRQAAWADARRADELERARLHAERLATRQGPALIGSSPKTVRPEPPKRRHDKSNTVTLYRAADTR